MPGVHVVLTGTMPLSSVALLGFPHLGTPTMIRVPPKEITNDSTASTTFRDRL
jgi:hypothetical protein